MNSGKLWYRRNSSNVGLGTCNRTPFSYFADTCVRKSRLARKADRETEPSGSFDPNLIRSILKPVYPPDLFAVAGMPREMELVRLGGSVHKLAPVRGGSSPVAAQAGLPLATQRDLLHLPAVAVPGLMAAPEKANQISSCAG